MTNPMKDLDGCTDEELEQELARVLAHARGEVPITLKCPAQGQMSAIDSITMSAPAPG